MSKIKIPAQNSKSKIRLSEKAGKAHPANIHKFINGEFKIFNIDDICPDPDQPREIFDEETLEELSNSIKQEGVLQPIIVRIDEEGKTWLVAGERRLRASQKAGLKQIPAVITTKHNYREIQIIENIQRDDLKPLEEAKALQKLMDDFHYTQQDVAEKIGKSQTTIARTLSLNKLPDIIKKEYAHANISRRTLIEIAQKKDKEEQIRLFELAKTGIINSQQVRVADRKKPIPPRPNVLITHEKVKSLIKSVNKLQKEDLNIEETQLLLSDIDNLNTILLNLKTKLQNKNRL